MIEKYLFIKKNILIFSVLIPLFFALFIRFFFKKILKIKFIWIPSLIGSLIPTIIFLYLEYYLFTLFKFNNYNYFLRSNFNIGFNKLGITLNTGINHNSSLFIFISNIIILVSIIYSISNLKKINDKYGNQSCILYFSLLLILQSSIMGIFITTNIISVFFFYESTIIPVVIALTLWGKKKGEIAINEMIIYLFIGSIFILSGIIIISLIGLSDLSTIKKIIFELINSKMIYKKDKLIVLAFSLLIIGMMISSSIWPFQSWIIKIYRIMPISFIIIHAGIIKKISLYIAIQLIIPFFSILKLNSIFNQIKNFEFWIITILSIGIIIISLETLSQDNLRLMIIYDSILHSTYPFIIILSLIDNSFLFKTKTIILSLFFMFISGSLSITSLFLSAEYISNRTKTINMKKIKGKLTKNFPILKIFFIFIIMFNIAFPGSTNFLSKFFFLFLIFQYNSYFNNLSFFLLTIVSIYSIIISIVYNIRSITNIFFSKMENKELLNKKENFIGAHRIINDLNIFEMVCLIIPLLFLSIFGFFPNLIISLH
jgi:NADH-quinone oxidoreductase subunit M